MPILTVGVSCAKRIGQGALEMMRLGLGLGRTRGGISGAAIGDYTANGFVPDMAIVPRDAFYYSAGASSFDAITGGTFARASDGTFTDNTGTQQTAGPNVARVSHYLSDGSGGFSKAGMLVEDASSNILLHSDDFGNTVWGKSFVSVSDNVAAAPDGSMTADRIIGGNPTSFITQNKSVTSGVTYAHPVYAHADDVDVLQIAPDTGFALTYRNFDLVNGVLGDGDIDGFMEELAGGWFRCWVAATATSTVSGRVAITGVQSVTSGRLAGTLGSSQGILLWRGGCEANSVASSSIQTTTSAVARADDDLRIPAAVMQAAILAATGSSAMPAAISSSMHLLLTYADLGTVGQSTIYDRRVDANNRITVTMDTDGAKTGTFTLTMVNGGVSATVSSAVEIIPGINVTANLAWSVDAAGIGLALNGTDATQATAIGVPDLTPADVEYLSSNAVAVNARSLEFFAQIGSAGRVEANS